MTTGRTLVASLRTTPVLAINPARALRLVERSVTVYRKNWIFIVSGFAEPFFYLL
jgi:hypothetical protein